MISILEGISGKLWFYVMKAKGNYALICALLVF